VLHRFTLLFFFTILFFIEKDIKKRELVPILISVKYVSKEIQAKVINKKIS